MPLVADYATALIQFVTPTPANGAIFAYLEDWLASRGFAAQIIVLGDGDAQTTNIYARRRAPGPSDRSNRCLMFLGHVDVVPAVSSATERWRHDPFAATVEEGILYGRGAVDMKGAIAAFMAAIDRHLHAVEESADGDIAILLTGDEEGVATFGTRPVLEQLVADGEQWDGCITGEPTSVATVGDTAKHGRRGSMHFTLEVLGVAGHVGYPHLAHNAAQRLADILCSVGTWQPDQGDADFEPSVVSVTDIRVGNLARNVVPGHAEASIACRFGAVHTPSTLVASLVAHLSTYLAVETVPAEARPMPADNTVPAEARPMQGSHTWQAGGFAVVLSYRLSSAPFLTDPESSFVRSVCHAVETVTRSPCALRTTGGTSDSRFVRMHCPVIDLGLCNASMHAVDEQVAITDLIRMEQIYAQVLQSFFAA